MMILRFLAGVMVWVTIVTVNLALLGCTLYAYNMAGLLSKAGQFGATIAAQLPMDSDPTGARMERLCQAFIHASCLRAVQQECSGCQQSLTKPC
jgi:hypothetical protein